MTARPVLGGLIIANYITVTIGLETSIHRGKGHTGCNMFFVKLSQEVHNKIAMLPSEETVQTTDVC